MKFHTLLYSLVLLLWLLIDTPLYAGRTRVHKDITFMVRNEEKVADIARQFNLSTHALRSANTHLHRRLTPGQTLVIPVWLRKKASKLVKESADFSINDYELETDSLDPNVNVNFINMTEIEADSILIQTNEKNIRNINKSLATLNYRLDSALNADSKIIKSEWLDRQANDQMIRKLQAARELRTGTSGIAYDVDSLNQLKTSLIAENRRLRAIVNDYEYYAENVAFFAHQKHEKRTEIVIQEQGEDPAQNQIPPRKKKR